MLLIQTTAFCLCETQLRKQTVQTESLTLSGEGVGDGFPVTGLLLVTNLWKQG